MQSLHYCKLTALGPGWTQQFAEKGCKVNALAIFLCRIGYKHLCTMLRKADKRCWYFELSWIFFPTTHIFFPLIINEFNTISKKVFIDSFLHWFSNCLEFWRTFFICGHWGYLDLEPFPKINVLTKKKFSERENFEAKSFSLAQ